jgi:hypothetical protein
MRTTNNIQKTENKPIKKTIHKTFAIVISLVLISFTVSAQGFWKQILVNNTYGKMAELMVEQKNSDDQLLKTNARFSETSAEMPVINCEKASQMTFETYFGSQWGTNLNTIKANALLVDWRLDESIRGN